MSPKNIVMKDEDVKKIKPNGVGEVGSLACGDVMKFWIHIDSKTNKITKCMWKTFIITF